MMRWIGIAALAALLLPQGLSAQRAPAPDAALAEGKVIPSLGEAPIGGWRRLFGGYYLKRAQDGLDESGKPECCTATYERGNAYMALRTEPVTRNAQGLPLTERIVRAKWITRRPDERLEDCTLLWISPQLSLYNHKTGEIRSVFVENGEYVILSWRDPGGYCTFGD